MELVFALAKYPSSDGKFVFVQSWLAEEPNSDDNIIIMVLMVCLSLTTILIYLLFDINYFVMFYHFFVRPLHVAVVLEDAALVEHLLSAMVQLGSTVDCYNNLRQVCCFLVQ